jgi:hypothetical protein
MNEVESMHVNQFHHTDEIAGGKISVGTEGTKDNEVFLQVNPFVFLSVLASLWQGCRRCMKRI